MSKLIVRWAINAVAIWLAIKYVPGIEVTRDSFGAIIMIALVFGLVNAVFRPLLALLTCPFIILTMGLGMLLVNTVIFWLAGYLGKAIGFGFTVAGFWPAFLGALMVSLVSFFLGLLVSDDAKE